MKLSSISAGLVAPIPGSQEPDALHAHRDLMQRIRDGEFAAGERLPTERTLAGHYGVSRNTIRNVLSAMQSHGFVERKMGSGTYLSATAVRRLVDDKPVAPHHDNVPNFVEILEGRMLFEPEMMQLAAKRADASDFDAMREQLRLMRDASDWIEFKERLYGVHMAIFRATKNRFLIQIFESIVADRRAVDYDGGAQTHSPVSEYVREQTLKELNALVEALLQRDDKTAVKRAKDYFVRILSSVAVYG
jgi:DNA-binding FadR family transcriptional regulator